MIVSFLLLLCGLFLNDFIGYSLLVNINLAETIILNLQAILFYIFSKKASGCGNSYIVNGILVTLSLIVIFQFRRLGARLYCLVMKCEYDCCLTLLSTFIYIVYKSWREKHIVNERMTMSALY
jgi:hypothetical protein